MISQWMSLSDEKRRKMKCKMNTRAILRDSGFISWSGGGKGVTAIVGCTLEEWHGVYEMIMNDIIDFTCVCEISPAFEFTQYLYERQPVLAIHHLEFSTKLSECHSVLLSSYIDRHELPAFTRRVRCVGLPRLRLSESAQPNSLFTL